MIRTVAALVLFALAVAAGQGSKPAPLRVTVEAGGLTAQVATAVADGPGRALSVAHVLDGAREVRVAGRPARVLRVDQRLDLAVLEVRGLRAPRLRFARAGDDAQVRVLRGGRSRMIDARVRRLVTAEVDHVHVRPAIELGASVLAGDSGAPVTDRRGRVVGLVFARAASGTAWALDLSRGRAR